MFLYVKQAFADDPITGLTVRVVDQPGRRMRAWMRLVCVSLARDSAEHRCGLFSDYAGYLNVTTWPAERPLSYRQLLDAVAGLEQPDFLAVWQWLDHLPLRGVEGTISAIPERVPLTNPSLPRFLQDLGDTINTDIAEACEAFDDPNCWYPGVDGGINPVSDEHVRFVIWGLQRELDRELRDRKGRLCDPRLPAAPLARLPWRVQRALVERRRLRFQQWGIRRDDWRRGNCSFWRIPEDPDWMPALRHEDDL